jgi:SAM-dependent methyltransferase
MTPAPETEPGPSDVEAFFSKRAGLYHNAVVGLLGYGWGLRVLLERSGYLRSGMRVLDAGCGTGALTRGLVRIVRRGALDRVTLNGFDLTPAMLGLLRTWLEAEGANVELRQANVLDLGLLPRDWSWYDLIVSSAMLEYLTPAELVEALRGLAGLLAPGGTMLVCITRRNALMRWLVGAWWRSRMYEKEELDGIFREAGLMPQFGRFPFPATHLNLWGHVVVVCRSS